MIRFSNMSFTGIWIANTGSMGSNDGKTILGLLFTLNASIALPVSPVIMMLYRC